MKQSILFAAIITGVLFASCSKDREKGYPKQPSVNYQLLATNTGYGVSKTTAVADIQWTSAFAYPDVIKFEAKQDNLEVEFKSTHNDRIDLLSPVAVTFGNFTIPPGVYDEIELKMYLSRNGSMPVLQLEGMFTSASLTVPIIVEVTGSVELKTEQHDIEVTNDADYTAVTTLDLSMITAGITTNMLLNAKLTNGSIVIASGSNSNLYDIIVDNLQHKRHHCNFKKHHH